jgi:hypothetical protein
VSSRIRRVPASPAASRRSSPTGARAASSTSRATPATLARDLAVILGRGFALRSCALFDLFAFTHRVEAVVSLDRAA